MHSPSEASEPAAQHDRTTSEPPEHGDFARGPLPVTVLGVDTRSTPRRRHVMELTIQKPEEEKVDFAVLYGGKAF